MARRGSVKFPQAVEFAEWVLRRTRSGTVADFGRAYGEEYASKLYRWQRGENRPDFDAVMAMLRVTGILTDQLPDAVAPRPPIERLGIEVAQLRGDMQREMRIGLLEGLFVAGLAHFGGEIVPAFERVLTDAVGHPVDLGDEDVERVRRLGAAVAELLTPPPQPFSSPVGPPAPEEPSASASAARQRPAKRNEP